MSFRQPTYNFKLVIEGVQYDIDEPEGFMDVKSKIERDLNLHGVFYEYTPDHIALKFSGVAKTLLRGAFNADGVDSESRVGFLLEEDNYTDVIILGQTIIYGEGIVWAEVGTDTLPIPLIWPSVIDHDSKMWVIGGLSGASASQKIYTSTDGETWSEVGTDVIPDSGRYAHASLIYDSKIWIIGGRNAAAQKKTVYYSSDNGLTWNEAGTNSLPVNLIIVRALVYDSKMWIIGGRSGVTPQKTVYHSSDGITWTEAGTNSLPVPLDNHDVVVFDSKMWIIGGRTTGANPVDEVYYSTDGITWTLAGTLPLELEGHRCVVFDDRIWLVGGIDSSSQVRTEVYWTTDGVTWTEEQELGLPDALTNFSLVEFDSNFYTIAGDGDTNEKVFKTQFPYDYETTYGTQTVYSGNIDFSHAIEDNKYFYCSILRSDLLVDLLNNKDKEVNLLSGETIFGTWSYPESLVDIYLHSFKILKQFEGTKDDPATGYALESGTPAIDFVLFGFDELVKQEISTYQAQTYGFVSSIQSDNTDAIIIFDVNNAGAVTVDVVYDFDFYTDITSLDPADKNYTFIYTMKIEWYNENGVLFVTEHVFNDQTTELIPAGATNYIHEKTISGSFTSTTRTLLKDSFIKVYVEFSFSTPSGNIGPNEYKLNTDSLSVSVNVNTVEDASTAKGMLIRDALESNLRMITGLPDPLSSTFFSSTGCGYNNVLTNGWQIRKFEDQPIITSWKKLFKSVQAIFGLGYGVEGTRIKVELWEHFYKDAELIDLGEVGNYKEEVMGDEIFNKVVLGFNSYANDENLSNTKEDFHTEAAWNTPIINHVGEFTQKSDIICSSFLIESVRRDQFKEKPSESTRWDDHLFLIATKKDYFTPYYLAERQDDAFETVTGLTNPDTAYNLRHTIKRMLLNWGVWINSFSMRYKDLTAKCRNLFFINNGDLTIKFNDSEACPLGDINIDTLTEKDDITKDEILNGEALFDQKTIKFTKSLSQEQLDIIRDAHEGQGDDYNVINYGYITVQDYDGVDQRGWLLDCTYNLHDKQADFVLIKRYALATPGSGETVGGYIELLMCLVDTGGGGITLSTTIPRISQLIYINGTITEIVIKSWTAALRRVRIKISKMGGTTIGGDNVGWDGKPILNKSGFSLANQLDWYESEVDLVFGENTIPINKSFSTDAYALIIERVSADVDIGRVTQPDPSSACQDIIYMGFQSYTAGSWNALSTQFPMWHEQKYNYSPTDTRSLFITNISYSDLAVDNGTAEGAGQQVIFAKAATLSTVKFFFTKTGSPTGTYKIAIWSTSAGLPDTQLSDSDITPVNGINSVTLNQALAADTLYAITITYNSDGLADASNYWSIRRLLSNGYRYGVSIEKAASVWSETSENLMTKITYVQS